MQEHRDSPRGYIVVTLRAFVDEGSFVSECVELQTASQGDSLEDAIDMALDATTVYLDSIAEDGDLERILGERSVEVVREVPEHVDLHTSVHPGDLMKSVVLPLPELVETRA